MQKKTSTVAENEKKKDKSKHQPGQEQGTEGECCQHNLHGGFHLLWLN
jgi:hypothetical protein